MLSHFTAFDPTLDAYWRAIVLFGRNTASYKFALARALLEVAERQQTVVTLEELAVPYSRYLLQHLKHTSQQATSPSSRFLDAGRAFLANQITEQQLLDQTVQLGFANVIDAFHIVNQDEIPIRFFLDRRADAKGIEITDALFQLREIPQFQNLPFEVEARWQLVETAWSLKLPPSLLVVRHEPGSDALFIEDSRRKRVSVTGSRDALNGYQKGKCFFCFADLSIDPRQDDMADVDHFFPHTLVEYGFSGNINGIWNLVLTCKECNRGAGGKFARVPELRYLERLHKRNNFLINSHHPLRETIMNQTGGTEEQRKQFLQGTDRQAIALLIHRWRPASEEPAVF